MDPDQDDGLTEAERAEVAEDAKSPGADPSKVVESKEADTDDADEKDEQQEAAPSATDKLAAAADSLARVAEAIEAQNRKPVEEQATEQRNEAPDFDKLRDDLRTSYRSEIAAIQARSNTGDIDDDELETLRAAAEARYEDEREKLLDQRAEAKAAAKVDERLRVRTEADETKAWNDALAKFGSDTENAKLLEDPSRKAAFAATIHMVAKDKPGLSYEQILVETKTRIQKAFGIQQATDTSAADKIKRAQAERDKKAGKRPLDLDSVPAAGGGRDERANPFQDMDDLDIDALENQLAHMKPDKAREYLETAPGGLIDNPRG